MKVGDVEGAILYRVHKGHGLIRLTEVGGSSLLIHMYQASGLEQLGWARL